MHPPVRAVCRSISIAALGAREGAAGRDTEVTYNVTIARRRLMAGVFVVTAVLLLAAAAGARAASAEHLNRDSAQALRSLTQSNKTAADISHIDRSK